MSIYQTDFTPIESHNFYFPYYGSDDDDSSRMGDEMC